jgi:RimJ/RimL family protein N-acetyltransferase
MTTPEANPGRDDLPGFADRLEITDRIALRIPKEDDAPRILELVQANRGDLSPWFPWVQDMYDLESAKKYISDRAAAAQNKDLLAYLIERKGEAVGAISVQLNWYNQIGNIGIWLDKLYRGQGIAKASVRRFASYCFSDLGIHRLEMNIATDNYDSLALAQSLGFRNEGTRKEAWKDGDKYKDMAMYSLIEGQLQNDA